MPRKLLRSSSDLKRRLRLVVAVALVVLPATPALAKSYWMANADVTVVVNDDGSLSVTELLTFDFSGEYSGSYRDIPLRPGESIEIISVGDEQGSYRIGGCTSLGCLSPAGSYGVEQHHDFVRVVWHHDSRSELRTFQLVYQMRGLATVYDDVVDVNIQVWGDQWAVGLNRLTARMMIPGGASEGEVLVWGHPVGVNGSTSLGDDRIRRRSRLGTSRRSSGLSSVWSSPPHCSWALVVQRVFPEMASRGFSMRSPGLRKMPNRLPRPRPRVSSLEQSRLSS